MRLSKTISSSSSPTRTGLPFGARKKDAIQPAIGNRAAIQNGQPLRSLARRQHVAHAIPGEARPQFGEFIRRIAPAQQIEHAFERRAGQLAQTARRCAQIVKRSSTDDLRLGSG